MNFIKNLISFTNDTWFIISAVICSYAIIIGILWLFSLIPVTHYKYTIIVTQSGFDSYYHCNTYQINGNILTINDLNLGQVIEVNRQYTIDKGE